MFTNSFTVLGLSANAQYNIGPYIVRSKFANSEADSWCFAVVLMKSFEIKKETSLFLYAFFMQMP